MSDEKVFADGFLFKRNEKAPDFVVGQLSIRLDEAIPFLKENAKNGWVNLGVKQARSGKFYVELDTFEPKKAGGEQAPAPAKASAPASAPPPAAQAEDDLPF